MTYGNKVDYITFYNEHVHELKPAGKNEYKGHCPFPQNHPHGDRNPSFSVNSQTGRYQCFSCGTKGNLQIFCRAKGIPVPGQKQKWVEPEAVFDYPDENGTLLYQACRFPGKQFKQRRPDGSGKWIYQTKDVRKVPYRLPELLKADPDAWVFISEGEKHVDQLYKLDLVATCNVGGAEKWTPELNQYLKDRKVCILPDNDSPGQKHGRKVAHSLCTIAREIKLLNLPGLGPKGDVINWLDAGGTVEELFKLLEQVEPWKLIESDKTGPEDERSVEQQNRDTSWKELVDQLEPAKDPIEAIQQVRSFTIIKLLDYDETTVSRILKGPLKQKFSLDTDEIKGILKAWKEVKNEARIRAELKIKEVEGFENIEKKLSDYISNPIFERDGRIWKIKIKEKWGVKIPEDVPITTFIIKPIESITIKGEGEILLVNLRSGQKEFDKVLFLPGCWASIPKFVNSLPGKETVFTGTATDVQHLRFYLSKFQIVHKTGIRTSGFHNGQFITEEGALSVQGVSKDLIYFNEVPSNCKLLSTKPATTDELAEIRRHVEGFNIPTVTLPILGWTIACYFKVIISEILDEMGLGNGFPLLNLQGEAGSGKTSSIQNVVMRMWAIDSEPKSIGELTKFTMMKMVDGSNCIPVVLEENKSCMQTDYYQSLISNLIRSTYNCHEGERGRANQTTQVYRYQAPVVIAGETGFTESALLDRNVTVFFSKKDSAPYLKNFKELRKQPLQKLGRTILEKALSMSKDDIRAPLEEELKAINPDLADRPRTNASVVRFGLRILGDVLGMQFNLSRIDEAVKEGIKEGDSVHRKSAVDKILEAMCLMSAFQKKIATYKEGGREEKYYKYQDHLEDGVDYEIDNEPNLPILKLFISNTYSVFKKWAKAYRFEGDLLPQGTFSKQLKKESYCIFVGAIKIDNKTVWGAKLDILKMRNKGLELSEFWGADPDEAPF